MSHPYQELSPDRILDAVESQGYEVNGSLLALNSYENRVLQIGLEGRAPIIGKFYRPQRWSDAAILEDHAFSQELSIAEIPVVAPLANHHAETLFQHQGFRFALYPRQGGRSPDLENPDQLQWIGRFLGRIHALGANRNFIHRKTLSVHKLGWKSLDYLKQSACLPPEVANTYTQQAHNLLQQIEQQFPLQEQPQIRLHGDCHPGNILWTDHGPHFVDMDDCCNGPAVQDLWMLLSGNRREMTLQMSELLEGYRMFYDFDTRQLQLIEPLRTLRLIHYSAWLARRWDDPAFPRAFPWFNSLSYWQEQLQILQQQQQLLNEPALQVY